MIYSRLKPIWLVHYMLYLGIYAFFTIFNTYEFFSDVYLPSALPFFDTLAMYVTFITGLILLVAVPKFILSLTASEQSMMQRIFPYAVTGLFLVMMIFAAAFQEFPLNELGSALMNGYLGGITLYGLIRIRKEGERGFYGVTLPFLYVSCFFYFLVTLQSILLPLMTTPVQYHHISIFTAGIICFTFGAVSLGYMLIKNYRREDAGAAGIPEAFAANFSITPREKEIITLLLQGKSNKDIGEELFVSPRTVEAHVYNIYKKCSVKNKLELVGKISSCS